MYRYFLPLAISCLLISCSTKVDMPRGTSKGYTSARLVQRDSSRTTSDPKEQKMNTMIQKSLKEEFQENGVVWKSGSTDLIVAYMVVYQEPGMTVSVDEYFGYGRNSSEITDRAHKIGVLDNKRPDYFKRAAIIVDVIDANSNELVYRNFAQADVIKGVSDRVRSQRIRNAVDQALSEFF